MIREMLSERRLSTFLYFGYLPYVPTDVKYQPWATGQTEKQVTKFAEESELIAQGIYLLKSAFEDTSGDLHVVPLSGGLDSRAILGGLLDAGLKNQITTVTFGTPGTWDYDIGYYVAGEMDVRHECFDLTQVQLTQELLEETAKEVGNCIWLFDAFYNRLVCKRFSKDAAYWSGFMGDPLAGSHLLSTDSESWDAALGEFAKRNRFSRSIDLTQPGFNPKDILPESPILADSRLSYDEQLDFAIRQQSYIKTLVLPKGYGYRTPFLHPEWVSFILNVPCRYRENQYLYKGILKRAYPKLFSLPTKSNRGLPLDALKWRFLLRRLSVGARSLARRFFPGDPWVHPTINYIDFDWALRNREDVRTLVYNNIQNLKRRGVVDWIDIDGIWDRHKRKQANHADALTLLASLEIILKVNCSAKPLSGCTREVSG